MKFPSAGIKPIILSYPHCAVADTQSDFGSFEVLAMPLFGRLYNFAHWLAQDRSEAEDRGRVAYFERSSGAQLIFNLRKHQLSVFIFKKEPRELPFHQGTVTSTRLALQMETWSEGGLRYFIVSDAPASDVHALSELLRKAARS
jgi:hypothetical protein